MTAPTALTTARGTSGHRDADIGDLVDIIELPLHPYGIFPPVSGNMPTRYVCRLGRDAGIVVVGVPQVFGLGGLGVFPKLLFAHFTGQVALVQNAVKIPLLGARGFLHA